MFLRQESTKWLMVSTFVSNVVKQVLKEGNKRLDLHWLASRFCIEFSRKSMEGPMSDADLVKAVKRSEAVC